MKLLPTNKKLKRAVQITLVLIGLALIFSITANLMVSNKSQYTYNSVEDIPHNRVGLVLGTSKFLANGYENYYFKYRIEAAFELYQAGKIDYILVSGDNSRKEYDEPTMMRDDLIALGVPANKIFLDYAGFRTWDSVVRCKEIFGQTNITIISQQFHNERAIFIAHCNDMEAVGYNAKDVNAYFGFKTQMREKLARVKVVLDYLVGNEPKYLGDKIGIQ
jgi:SanA protein